MTKEKQPEPPLSRSFEEALTRLEEIARQLEEGQLGLAESLASYEEGVKCLKQCYELLETAERKIELLAGVDAQGNPRTEPFAAEPVTLEEVPNDGGPQRDADPPPVPGRPKWGEVDEQELLF